MMLAPIGGGNVDLFKLPCTTLTVGQPRSSLTMARSSATAPNERLSQGARHASLASWQNAKIGRICVLETLRISFLKTINMFLGLLAPRCLPPILVY